jgi:hypothetical protein
MKRSELIAGGVFAMLIPVFRRNPAARFWAVGLVLSSIPLCTTPPSDRLLLLLPLSGMAFVDILVHELRAGTGGRVWRLGAGALAAGWIVIHGVLSPIDLPSTVRTLVSHDEWLEVATESACEGVGAISS